MNAKTYWILVVIAATFSVAFFISGLTHHIAPHVILGAVSGTCALLGTFIGLFYGAPPPNPSKDDLNLAIPQAQSCAIAADFAKNAKFALDSIGVKNRIIRSIQEAVSDGRFEFETYITEENFDLYRDEFLAQGFSMKLDMNKAHDLRCEVTNNERFLMTVQWYKS